MPRRKGSRITRPGTFQKGNENPKYRHGLYGHGREKGRILVEKRDTLLHLSSRSLLRSDDTSDYEEPDTINVAPRQPLNPPKQATVPLQPPQLPANIPLPVDEPPEPSQEPAEALELPAKPSQPAKPDPPNVLDVPGSRKRKRALPMPIQQQDSDTRSLAEPTRQQETSARRASPTPSQQQNPEQLVETLNALPPSTFLSRYLPATSPLLRLKPSASEHTYSITPSHISTLATAHFNRCFGLIKETSYDDYRASQSGWNPTHKLGEMKDPRMWYLLVREDAPWFISDPETSEAERFRGFLSFLLDTEDIPPSNTYGRSSHDLVKVPILYIYELHLTPSTRGLGLGKRLMEIVDSVGRKIGVEKTMLTVFTRNETAEAVYRHLGYKEDVISAVDKRLRRGVVKKPEYYILSRGVEKEKVEVEVKMEVKEEPVDEVPVKEEQS